MYKKSFFLLFAFAVALPTVALAQVASINGNMDATMSRGQTMTFQLDIVIGSQGYTGFLNLVMRADPVFGQGLGFLQGSSSLAAMPCSSDKTGTSCKALAVSLAPGAVIHITQPILVFTDATGSPQAWSAELHGDFLSGGVVRKGLITLTDKRARIEMVKAPEVMLQVPDGSSTAILVLQNVGDAPGETRVSNLAGAADLVSIGPAVTTLQPGELVIVVLTSHTTVPLGENPGTLQVTRPFDDPILVKIRVDVAERPTGTPNAQPAANRVDIALPPDGSPRTVGVNVSNLGTGKVVGAFDSDGDLFIAVPSGIITIDPGQTKTFDVGVDSTQIPSTIDTGSVTGTVRLTYLNGASGKGLRPLDSPGTSTVSIGFVATVAPPSSTAAIPPLAHRCQTIGCWDEVAVFVPGVGHVAGSVGLFISDVTLFPNVGPGTGGTLRSLADVDMYFTPLGGSSATAKKVSVGSVVPPSSTAFADMVSTVYGVQQVGSLQIRAPGFLPDYVVGVNANVFNVSNKAGTYGTSLPMFLSYSAAKDTDKVFLTGLRKDATSHTNLYLQEAQGSDISANIDFYDGSGNKIGSTSANVPAFAAVQLGGSVVPNNTVSAILSVGSGGGALHAYATPVDEASGDTWVVADWSRVYSYYQSYLPATGVNVLVPIAGAAHGANNTYFKTDAAVMNVGSVPASGTFRYFIRGGQTIEKTINLNPLQTQVFNDITTNFFGMATDSIGYITYRPTAGRVAITSRNYTTTPGSSATFGTAVPTLPLQTNFPNGGSASGYGLSSGRSLRISGVEDAALATVGRAQPGSFRSNFGLVEVSGQSATVQVTVYYNTNTDKTSAMQGGSATFTMAPNEIKLIGNVANAILGAARASLGDLHNITVEFTVTGGTGRVVPFVSSIDNGSGDSTFRVN